MADPEAPPDGSGAAPSEGAAPERQAFPFLVLQFFIFPLAIVAVCVTVFVVFGMIASEGKSARDYLSDVRSGGASRRWQAAFELAKLLKTGKDPSLSDPRFASELVALFEEAERDDPRVRRYLALALGRLADRSAVPALLRAMRPAEGPEAQTADAETQIYAIWALGEIGDEAAVPELTRLAGSDDPGVRKAAVHALGSFDSAESRAALERSLADAAADVRWNAALALGRRGQAAAAPVLLEMLDRARLATLPEITPEQREEALRAAAQAAGGLADPRLAEALRALRDGDASLKVREAARSSLEAQRTP
jgi:HEAT repeat protein